MIKKESLPTKKCVEINQIQDIILEIDQDKITEKDIVSSNQGPINFKKTFKKTSDTTLSI